MQIVLPDNFSMSIRFVSLPFHIVRARVCLFLCSRECLIGRRDRTAIIARSLYCIEEAIFREVVRRVIPTKNVFTCHENDCHVLDHMFLVCVLFCVSTLSYDCPYLPFTFKT